MLIEKFKLILDKNWLPVSPSGSERCCCCISEMIKIICKIMLHADVYTYILMYVWTCRSAAREWIGCLFRDAMPTMVISKACKTEQTRQHTTLKNCCSPKNVRIVLPHAMLHAPFVLLPLFAKLKFRHLRKAKFRLVNFTIFYKLPLSYTYSVSTFDLISLCIQ